MQTAQKKMSSNFQAFYTFLLIDWLKQSILE